MKPSTAIITVAATQTFKMLGAALVLITAAEAINWTVCYLDFRKNGI
jgi:hypothetical protein